MDRKLKVMRFAADGAPMLNKNLAKMISYVKEREVVEFIEIVTSGSCLGTEINGKIINFDVDRIRIPIEAVDAKG